MADSWIDDANDPAVDFPLENLPFGVVATETEDHCATAIGSFAVDLALLEAAGLIDAGGPAPVFDRPALNDFIALGPARWSSVRAQLLDLLSAGGRSTLRDSQDLRQRALIPLAGARLLRPIRIGGYTDFNASRQHAVNAGRILRGAENALPANWMHMPVAYNGRASTVVVSGTPIRRPFGQFRKAGSPTPVFGPTERLDFELEMGVVVGVASPMGKVLTVAEADAMIFGHVLLNDWSARDIQAWETVPLGPFQGKVFGTSISPWIVTREALDPFRLPRSADEDEDEVLPYLREPGPMHHDISLHASIVRAGEMEERTIVRTNARHLHWSPAQMLTQHAVCGCAMEVGDLLGTGTISGPDREAWACLLEQTLGGREPVPGLDRTWLHDGDTVILRGHAERDGFRIGFGECRAIIVPAMSAEETWR